MMRRLSYLLLMAFALLACNRKMEDEETGPYVEITLTTGDPSNIVTKSEEDGSAYQEEGIEKTFHENRIQKVDLFFYPSDNTDEPATYHKRIDYTGNEKVKSDLLRLYL